MKYLIPFIMMSFPLFGQGFNWQGHRGCRGLMPENSLPAFEKALELGVMTLEIDVVISKDNEVVVSHDPWMQPPICSSPDGYKLSGQPAELPNLYHLTYEEISLYDCGSTGHPNFPDQQKMKVRKPRLIEVFRMAEKYCKDNRRNEVYYNIEIKSREEWDDIYHPSYWNFCDLVYKTIDAYVPWSRVNIQSFDHRVLQYFHKTYPEVKLAVLEEFDDDPERVLARLGFTPQLYSPNFRLLKPRKVEWLHENGMQVIPWTVNTIKDMKDMMEMDVDGIITDYPNLIKEIDPDF